MRRPFALRRARTSISSWLRYERHRPRVELYLPSAPTGIDDRPCYCTPVVAVPVRDVGSARVRQLESQHSFDLTEGHGDRTAILTHEPFPERDGIFRCGSAAIGGGAHPASLLSRGGACSP